eukprot:m.200393 g.200393  ORF g.200393 m.200393 type:complete len:69 (-) comp17693_c1_seq3:4287-4493(-)
MEAREEPPPDDAVLRKYILQLLQANTDLRDEIIDLQAQLNRQRLYTSLACGLALSVLAALPWLLSRRH